MPRTAIQLWTLRSLDEPLVEILERVSKTNLDGVEFAGLGKSDPQTVRDQLERFGLDVAAAHVGIQALEDDFDSITNAYETIGCEQLVVPMIDESGFESRDAIEETARRLSAVGQRVSSAGFEYSYHNHAHEFAEVDGTRAFDILAQETTDVGFELDIGWMYKAGADPAEYIRSYSDRVSLVHVTDVDENGAHAEPGDGVVPLDESIQAAKDAGVEWLIHENDEPADAVESLEHASRTLPTLIMPESR